MKFSEDSNLKKFFEERFSSFERFIDPDKKEITGKFYAGEKIFGIGFYAVKIKKNKPLKKSMFSRIPKSKITSEKY